MLCRKPFIKEGKVFGCGQCLHCRIHRRRVWTHRLMLEARCHDKSTFLTLTYNPEQCPEAGTLVPDHFTKFIKRVRRAVAPHRIRYFVVGEYGDKTERPHYHAIIFGLSPLDSELYQRCWTDALGEPRGYIYAGDVTFDSCQYVAGYCVKKLTNVNNAKVKEWLNGRYPEYARMSNRPGIGALYIRRIIEPMCRVLDPQGGVPSVLSHGSKKYPLGRYLRSRMRQEFDCINEETGEIGGVPIAEQKEYDEALSLLFEDFEAFKGVPLSTQKAQHLIDKNSQTMLNREKKFNVYKKEKKL